MDTKTYCNCPWAVAFDTTLKDLDYRVLMMLIDREKKLKYFHQDNYVIEISWFAKKLQREDFEIACSFDRLISAGYVVREKEKNRYCVVEEKLQERIDYMKNYNKAKQESKELKLIEEMKTEMKAKGMLNDKTEKMLDDVYKSVLQERKNEELFQKIML